MQVSKIPVRDRLAARSQPVGECIEWTGCLNDRGYGMMSVGNKRRYVHRLAYEAYVGPIPAGLELDHLCHTRDPLCAKGVKCPHRRCLNPNHLQLVTSGENSRRGEPARRSHCPKGHPYDDANTGRTASGRRYCKRCHVISVDRRQREQRSLRGPIPPKTHCKHGHPFNKANTYVDKYGWKTCRVCKRDWMRNFYRHGKEKV